jgi:hypothetical protein
LPPIYIIFSIFGGFYANYGPDERRNFTFHPEIMAFIEQAINNIQHGSSPVIYAAFFLPVFKKFFFNAQMPPIHRGGSINENLENQHGGKRYKPYLARNYFKPVDNSQLAYYITVDLELSPGTSLTSEEAEKLKCTHKWNLIRKAYSNLVGKPYNITPVYQTQTLKNKGKNKPNQVTTGGKGNRNRNKTMKLL